MAAANQIEFSERDDRFWRAAGVSKTKPIPRRRLASMTAACEYGGFARTKCYELIKQGRIVAYKLDHKTLIDLNSIDELHDSLPQIAPKRRSQSRG